MNNYLPSGDQVLRRATKQSSNMDENKNFLDLLDFNINTDKSDEDLFNDLIRKLEFEQERRSNLTQHSKEVLIDELNRLNMKLKEKMSKEMVDKLDDDDKSNALPFVLKTNETNQLFQADLPGGLSLLDKVKKINNNSTSPEVEAQTSQLAQSTTTTSSSTTATTTMMKTSSTLTASTATPLVSFTYNPKPTTTRSKIGPNDYTRRPSTTIIQSTMAPRRSHATKSTASLNPSSRKRTTTTTTSTNLSSIRVLSTLVPAVNLTSLSLNDTRLVSTKPTLLRILGESNRKINESIATATRSDQLSTTESLSAILNDGLIKPALASSLNISRTLGHQHVESSAGGPVLCSCNNTSVFSSPSFRQPNNFLDQYSGIWKFSFFILAFLIGFISLLLVLTFFAKAVMLNIQKRNLFGFRTYRLKNLASKSDKITSASLDRKSVV